MRCPYLAVPFLANLFRFAWDWINIIFVPRPDAFVSILLSFVPFEPSPFSTWSFWQKYTTLHQANMKLFQCSVLYCYEYLARYLLVQSLFINGAQRNLVGFQFRRQVSLRCFYTGYVKDISVMDCTFLVYLLLWLSQGFYAYCKQILKLNTIHNSFVID